MEHYWCVVSFDFVLQGNLVNYLRTRGRSVVTSVQLLRFALWVQARILKSYHFDSVGVLPVANNILCAECGQIGSVQCLNSVFHESHLRLVCVALRVAAAAVMCVRGWSTWSLRSWFTEIWQLVTSWSLTTVWPRSATLVWPRWTPRLQKTSSCRSNGRPPKLWRKRFEGLFFYLLLVINYYYYYHWFTNSNYNNVNITYLFMSLYHYILKYLHTHTYI